MPGWRRTAGAAWPLLQGTAAATVAWIAAKHVALHSEPFFAPIAAVIGLNAPFRERGSNTLRLLLGVFVGIIVAELALLVLGAGYGRLALATFVAMAVARALGGARIVIGQAAASAILTLATADGKYGLHRIGDAMIGATIALGFSQVLFSPEPIGLVRRAGLRDAPLEDEMLQPASRHPLEMGRKHAVEPPAGIGRRDCHLARGRFGRYRHCSLVHGIWRHLT